MEGSKARRPGREKLLDAAHEQFSASNYGDVGVAAILERAGVQAPTLYHHFGDKEGLFVAWAQKAMGTLGQSLRNPAPASLAQLAAALWEALDFDLAQALRDAGILVRPESREKVVAAYFEAVYEPLVAELVKRISSGEFRAEPVGRLADAFVGGLLALKRQGASQDAATWWADFYVRALRA